MKLIVSGKRMNVFINDAAQPTLEVGELLADTAEGGFELHGPALFANLTVTPGKTDGLSPTPSVDEIGSAVGIVHAWELGSLTDLHTDQPLPMPRDPTITRVGHGYIRKGSG